MWVSREREREQERGGDGIIVVLGLCIVHKISPRHRTPGVITWHTTVFVITLERECGLIGYFLKVHPLNPPPPTCPPCRTRRFPQLALPSCTSQKGLCRISWRHADISSRADLRVAATQLLIRWCTAVCCFGRHSEAFTDVLHQQASPFCTAEEAIRFQD